MSDICIHFSRYSYGTNIVQNELCPITLKIEKIGTRLEVIKEPALIFLQQNY